MDNIERAKEAFKKAMILGVLLMSVGAALILNYREALASIFIKDSPFALELAVEYLFFLLIGLPLMAIFQTFIGVYNGTGNTKYTFYLGVTRLWLLRIPLILIFHILLFQSPNLLQQYLLIFAYFLFIIPLRKIFLL